MTTLRSKGAFLAAVLAAAAPHASAPLLLAAQDADQSMQRETMRGLLGAQPDVPLTRAQHDCLALPVDPPNDRLVGPHGDTLIRADCKLISFEKADPAEAAKWSAAEYSWTSIFTAEDPAASPDAHDTVTEHEVVLFETIGRGQVRPVWHARFETGAYAVWRSVTPEIAITPQRTTLLSVQSCVNGTGGCGQDFLQRHADGIWVSVKQTWPDQLPHGYVGRIRHGVRINPRTLQAEAGFYGDRDPNCCPAQVLLVNLAVQGDSLILHGPVAFRPSPP
jgi:hypothetical protein